MTDATHSLTRLWLRQGSGDGEGHIAPGCSHDWGKALCGLDPSDLTSDENLTALCRTCLDAWSEGEVIGAVSIMLPRGGTFLLLSSGELQRGTSANLIERRAQAITRDLHPLSPESFGPLGSMTVSVEADGTPHGDPWCVSYDEKTAQDRQVSMGGDSVIPHWEGKVLHCQRLIPSAIEDAFFAALAACRARNGVLSVMGASGWGLYEAIRHEHGFHGTSDDHVCETGDFEVESSLALSAQALAEMPEQVAPIAQENARTDEVWRAVRRVMAGWAGSQEARIELGRAVLMLALASGETPSAPSRDDSRSPGHRFSSSIQAVVQYGIRNGPFLSVMNVSQARVALSDQGWTSPLRANKRIVEDLVLSQLPDALPQGGEAEVAEDLADFMVSQDHTLQEIAEHYMQEVQDGIFLEIDADDAPPHWSLWPHGTDESGRSLHWVPVPVAKASSLEALGASPAPFLPMTLREAEALLGRATGVRTR